MTKKPLGTSIDDDLRNRVRATVKGLQRRGVSISLTSATEDALHQWVTAMEAAENGGQPFPNIDGDLPRGRRLA